MQENVLSVSLFLLLQDPVVLPGQLQNELSHASPRQILALIASRAENKMPAPGDSIMLAESTNFDYPEHIQTAISELQPCPYMQTVKTNRAKIQDDMSEKISQYIQNTELQVDQVKKDLSTELDRLSALSSESFWRIYFSKLGGEVPKWSQL